MQHLIHALSPINIEAISVVELTKRIREASKLTDSRHNDLGLSQSLAVAYVVKEAYRLGTIRGRALK